MPRILITAAEAYCPLGPTISVGWPRLLSGEPTVAEVSHSTLDAWPGRWLAARWKDDAFSVAGDRPHYLALSAVLNKSGIDPREAGLCVCASKGLVYDADRPAEVDEFRHVRPSAFLDDVLQHHQFGGPVGCHVAACASGLVAVAQAADWIRHGRCREAMAGAADYSLNPLVMATYRRAGVLARWDGEAAAACRPFDRDRSGFVIGEGCGLLALKLEEPGDEAVAVLSGYDRRSDPHDLMSLAPSGDAIAACVRFALQDAGLTAGDVDAVCCHGTGTRLNDLAEARGLRTVFGARLNEVPCFSLKGAMGHTLGASGAVELAYCVRAVAEQTVPPHRNCPDRDRDCPVGPLPRRPLRTPIRHLLKLSFGFGGHVAAVVISAP